MKVIKATLSLLVELRIRRLNFWENGTENKSTLWLPFLNNNYFYCFRRWTNWRSIFIFILLYLPTDIWFTFVLKTGDERDMPRPSVYAAKFSTFWVVIPHDTVHNSSVNFIYVSHYKHKISFSSVRVLIKTICKVIWAWSVCGEEWNWKL